MTNAQRQPVTQKAVPGSRFYHDSTNNSKVGAGTRIEAVTQSNEPQNKGEIAPEQESFIN